MALACLINLLKKNMNNNFRTEFIRFLKSSGYPASGIFCNAKIGNTHVEYLITIPNSNEKLVIITAQGIDEQPAQIIKQLEFCRQQMDNADYQVCFLTPNDKADSQYPFSLYNLDNRGDLQEFNLKWLPTLKASSSPSKQSKYHSVPQMPPRLTSSIESKNETDKQFISFFSLFIAFAFSLLNLIEGLVSEDIIAFLVLLVLIIVIIFFIHLWRNERKKNKNRIQSGKPVDFWNCGDDGGGWDDGGGCE